MNDAADILPRWAIMWLLAGAMFFVGKALVWHHSKAQRKPWPLVKTFVWWFFWPGMDAAKWNTPISEQGRLSDQSFHAAIEFSFCKIAFGAFLLWGLAGRLEHPLAAAWTGMIGLIFLLHFGIFHALALLWQNFGINAQPIMRNPIAAQTIAEFWGKRWNLAFRDLAHVSIFRPVTARWGKHIGLAAVFLISGLVHDVLISLPAGAGFGLPTAYFALQGFGIVIERKYRLTKRPVLSWLRTHAFTAGPAFFLFHPTFVERVMIPFFQTIGALP